ncbi:MAG: adenylyltransferase/cytidyltransferase family protein [bacterium]
MKDKITVVASGYFDPIHIGHIEYLEKAKELGDKLIVVVNSNNQAILKKGNFFMDEKERMAIVKALRCVDEVFLSIDEDGSVCKTIEALKPNIFAKGGDRHVGNIPEVAVCQKINCEIISGLGDKIQSSSTLVKNAKLANSAEIKK